MTDLLSIKAADNFRLARSGSIITPAAGTYNLIRLPQYAFVSEVWEFVTVAGDSDTVDIGFVGNGEVADADYFLDSTYAVTSAIANFRASKDTVSGFAGKWFSAAGGMITMTVGTTQGTGIFIVFVQYTVIH